MTVEKVNELKERGFVRINKIDYESFYAFALKLGNIIQETDVKVRSDSKALVTSKKALDFHTDHHKAKYIGWYCFQQTEKGGETILTNASEAFNLMSVSEQKHLLNIMLFEHKVFDDDPEEFPLVQIQNGGLIFYYSFWLVKEKISTFEKEALATFQELIRLKQKSKFLLEPTDALFIDNHRILHGRTAIDGIQPRHLRRLWIN